MINEGYDKQSYLYKELLDRLVYQPRMLTCVLYGDGQFSSSIITDNSRPNVSYIVSRAKCYSSRTAAHRATSGILFARSGIGAPRRP